MDTVKIYVPNCIIDISTRKDATLKDKIFDNQIEYVP